MANNLGKQGENWAENYLVKKGYEILEKNYRYLKAEIDIIAKKDDVISIVEVKTRGRQFAVPLSQAISKKKIKLLVMAADHYILQRNLDCEIKFDVLAITFGASAPRIEHIEDAFYHF